MSVCVRVLSGPVYLKVKLDKGYLYGDEFHTMSA